MHLLNKRKVWLFGSLILDGCSSEISICCDSEEIILSLDDFDWFVEIEIRDISSPPVKIIDDKVSFRLNQSLVSQKRAVMGALSTCQRPALLAEYAKYKMGVFHFCMLRNSEEVGHFA